MLLLSGCGGQTPPLQKPVVRGSGTPAPPRQEHPSKAKLLERVVATWHEAGQFSGVVLVADKGRVVWQGGVGVADVETGRSNVAETVFPIASLTKQFTAMLVMQQVEMGNLSLETTVDQILSGYRGGRSEGITVRHLLRHVSGLPDIDPAAYLASDPGLTQSAEFLAQFGGGALRFEPGSRFAYTNTDYHVLTAMLEAVTGRSYEALLTEKILDPLGMHNSGIARRDDARVGWAVDAVPTADGSWVSAPAYRWENWQGAGAMMSTVGDIHLWNRALAGHELVSASTWQTMLTPRTDLLGGGNYVGLGSWVYPRGLPGSELTPRLIERRGAIGGYTTLNVLVAGEDRWVVLLSNRYDEGMHKLPYARCLPLDLLLVLYDLPPEGPAEEPGALG